MHVFRGKATPTVKQLKHGPASTDEGCLKYAFIVKYLLSLMLVVLQHKEIKLEMELPAVLLDLQIRRSNVTKVI